MNLVNMFTKWDKSRTFILYEERWIRFVEIEADKVDYYIKKGLHSKRKEQIDSRFAGREISQKDFSLFVYFVLW